jgi:hypothetical protein
MPGPIASFAVMIGLGLSLLGVSGAESVRHSLFIAGPTLTGIIDQEGAESWNAGRPALLQWVPQPKVLHLRLAPNSWGPPHSQHIVGDQKKAERRYARRSSR